MEITIYEFRSAVGDLTYTLPHVAKAELAKVERLIPVAEFSEHFGGYVIWAPPVSATSEVAGSSIGVWGLRNVSRFRRLLKERGATVLRVKGEGPAQQVRQVAKIPFRRA